MGPRLGRLHRYFEEACAWCGAETALCDLCDREARHFVEDVDFDFSTLYLCDVHVSPYSVWIAAARNPALWAWVVGQADVTPDAPAFAELGAYMPGRDGCGCDLWR